MSKRLQQFTYLIHTIMNASKPTKVAYYNYIGSIELPIEVIERVPLSGPADSVIDELRLLPEVIAELSEINTDSLVKELEQYGAWDEFELMDHNENLNRILWLACYDIREEMID